MLRGRLSGADPSASQKIYMKEVSGLVCPALGRACGDGGRMFYLKPIADLSSIRA
jgi:hypothetical protein